MVVILLFKGVHIGCERFGCFSVISSISVDIPLLLMMNDAESEVGIQQYSHFHRILNTNCSCLQQ